MLTHDLPAADMELRAKALGVPVQGRNLVGVVLRLRAIASSPLDAQARMRELSELAASSLRGLRALGLVGVIDDDTVGVLLSVANRGHVDNALEQFATRIRQQHTDVRRLKAQPATCPVR